MHNIRMLIIIYYSIFFFIFNLLILLQDISCYMLGFLKKERYIYVSSLPHETVELRINSLAKNHKKNLKSTLF